VKIPLNNALRRMGYDTKTEICGHDFRTMACGALVKSGMCSRDALERQMSHQERNNVRAALLFTKQNIWMKEGSWCNGERIIWESVQNSVSR
jgi:integrase